MESVLAVTTAATDANLLTFPQLKAAVGLKGSDVNNALRDLGEQVSGLIADACKVRGDGINPPTLRKETVKETFRIGLHCHAPTRPTSIVLSRRPVISIVSVIEDGVTLDPACYTVASRSGLLQKLRDGCPQRWHGRTTEVNYQAGLATVPANLRRAAQRAVQILWNRDDARDPNVRIEIVEGVGRTDYFDGGSSIPGLPAEVVDMLDQFMNHPIG